MVKGNELRIGNYFRGLIVESISSTGVNFNAGYEGYNETPFDQLMPIPLTPEILEKCGFEYDDSYDTKTWEKDWYYIQTEDDKAFSFASKVLTAVSVHHLGLKYLHQLQNLYYCLTGEELMFDFQTK